MKAEPNQTPEPTARVAMAHLNRSAKQKLIFRSFGIPSYAWKP
jgi:hypothetical protein